MEKYFMRRKELWRVGLRQLTKFVKGNDLTMVEIGSFAGESTEIFAKSGKFSKIYAIDPWVDNQVNDTGVDPYKKYSMSKIEAVFDERMSFFENLIKIKALSSDVVDQFDDKSLDFVYIDGNHDYAYVKEDIINWLPKIKQTGYISGHDWTLKGVNKAVQEELGKPWRVCKDSSWVFKMETF